MISKNARNALRLLVVPAAGILLSGCLGPTYGTGKSSGQQLFDDINGMVSFGPATDQEKIVYSPRRELVTPENTSVLPPPQAVSVAAAPAGPGAFESSDPANVVPADVATTRTAGFVPSAGRSRDRRDPSVPLTPAELQNGTEQFRERIKERQGNPQQRRYLSEPPVGYRQPAATAPVGDPGIDEDVKEARLQGGSEEGLGSKIRNLLPF